MCAEVTHTYPELAGTVDVSHDTLQRWRKASKFQKRVKELPQEIAGDLQTHPARGASRHDQAVR